MLDFLNRLLGQPGPARDSMLTVHLEHALAEVGCPLCRLTATTELRYFEGLWYENVNDPGVNEELLASRAFCTEHTRAIFAGQPEHQSPSGVAILFARFVRDLMRHAGSDAALLGWLRPTAPCPVCLARGYTESAYLDEFIRVAPQRPPTSDGTGVLCLPHLRALAPYVDAPTLAVQEEATTTGIARYEEAAASGRLALVVGRAPLGRLPPTPTCPACQAATGAARSTREVTALCRLHAWALHDSGRRDVAATVREVVSEDSCPACRAAAAAVAETLATLGEGTGLCLGHLRAALRDRRPVRASGVAALEELVGALRRFADSFDYRYTGTRSEEEIASWANVLARFGGESVGASVARALPFTGEADRGDGEWWRRPGTGR